MKTINLRGITNPLSEEELKKVKGGMDQPKVMPDHQEVDGGGGGTVSPKIEACKGLKENDRCAYEDENKVFRRGRCLTLLGPRHCSDLL
ncbi:MAG: hypothetical protein LBH19_11130 [Dysgonamonadaceae bacterium]|jgi:hypothetical protein|nr:hypothetical protein [Dysgonamonadaceae bacterium]